MALIVKSLEDQVLPSTAATTARLLWGCSELDRILVAWLQGGGSMDKPSV